MNLVGALPDTPGAYGDVNRHSDYQQAPRPPRAAARSPLFYVNASLVRDRIKTLVGAADPTPRAVILDMSANGDRLDITGADTLTELIGELHGAGIDVALVEIRLPVREMARRSGLLDALGSTTSSTPFLRQYRLVVSIVVVCLATLAAMGSIATLRGWPLYSSDGDDQLASPSFGPLSVRQS